MSTNGKIEAKHEEMMPPPDAPKSLVAKLAEACNAVGGIEKKGRNTKQSYDYVRAADVAKAIRHELFTRGIILLQDEVSLEIAEYQTNGGGVMQECRLKIAYTLKDDSEQLTIHAYGIARDSFDKAIYKAKTGATKYFLRGLGLIPDEKDDPEADGTADQEVKSAAPIQPHYPPRKPVEPDRPTASVPAGSIADFQKNAFLSACKKSGKTQAQILQYFGGIGIETIDEMPKKDFATALKWAMEVA